MGGCTGMRLSLSLAAAVAGLALVAPGAGAATWTVETTADGAGNAADCTVAAGTCSLRSALVAAAIGDTIVLGAGTYENTGQDFVVGIGEGVSIIGAGPRATTVRETSGGDGRVFLVEMNASLQLDGLTVSGSRDQAGVLLFGGGNSLSATRVLFTGNASGGSGGAIDGTGGAVALVESTVAGNSATVAGGGIHTEGSAATLSVTNSTVTANSAPAGSGVNVAGGSTTMTNVTLAGNAGGSDLVVGPAPALAALGRTIVGSCTGSAPSSLGFNLDPGSSCALSGQGDRSAADPALQALANNGGDTDTMALGSGSAAIDAAGGCPPPATDQRGVARPQGDACDIGAFEAAAAVGVEPSARLTRLRLRRVSRRSFKVSYRLDRATRVRFGVWRGRPGRRASGRCVPARRAKPKARRCTRWIRVRRFSRNGDAGGNVFRMRARGLHAGRHRLVATPGRGAAVTRPFRVRPFRP